MNGLQGSSEGFYRFPRDGHATYLRGMAPELTLFLADRKVQGHTT